jgi:hypothetical protein
MFFVGLLSPLQKELLLRAELREEEQERGKDPHRVVAPVKQ